jgi:hypothetical protein
MRTEVKSTKANNSTLTAPVSELQDILNLSNREIAKSFCKVQNFAYICIGKCDIQSTRSVFIPQYSGVPEVVLCTSRLPKHKGAPLFLYPYIN